MLVYVWWGEERAYSLYNGIKDMMVAIGTRRRIQGMWGVLVYEISSSFFFFFFFKIQFMRVK